MTDDVPSPIDLRLMPDATEWARTAEQLRPQRPQIFAEFARLIAEAPRVSRILELGSGPGFLAEHLLQSNSFTEYVAFDFSPAMHELAKERLGGSAEKLTFVARSFRDANWSEDLGEFDCIVALQSIHELRHKRYASTLHAQVREILAESGVYLMCDHFAGDGGMRNSDLFMTIAEQEAVLRQAGFEKVDKQLVMGSLVLFSAA